MRFCGNWKNGVDKRCDERYNLSCVCGRSSSGRARPCQGRGSEFEPRRPLQKETPSVRMVFSFWNAAGRLELAASTGAERVKSRGPAGLLRMALPFVGCRVASSSLVYFATQSAKNKEKPPFGWFFFWNAAGRMELAASTGAQQRTDCCRISCRAACPQAAAVYRRCLRLPRGGVRAPLLRMSASNRSVGDGVPDVPSARRCRAGNGFPVASRREASALGVLLGMTGGEVIDTLPPSDRMVFLFLQCPEKLRLQVPPAVQRRGDLPQQGVPVAVEGALQRQVVAGVVGAEHGSFAVHVL